MPYNNVMAICILLPLAVVNGVPGLAKKYLMISSPILTLGTTVLAAVALYANIQSFLHLHFRFFIEQVAFGVFILSLGYTMAEKVFADERRLLSIENELAIAREIQASILPSRVPTLPNLRVSAAYHPMTAVAGDFYDFIVVDKNRAGFLVADVSGHGVPAALIASMIKVAMQSVLPCAESPGEVLRGLNRILAGQLRGQFVSAAYLWLDMNSRKALYSAAGHPSLLRCRQGKLDRIESNGLLLGVLPESEYLACELTLNPGDRFLLHTGGVVEPENAAGRSFGEGRLEQVVRSFEARPPAELSDELLSELRQWQPPSTPQQDDITLIVIDVVGPA
jgi:sigma-B regulation protein RsbU (phosphoserine phosphatase)